MLIIAGTMLGLLVSAVNQTVVSTALPRIIGELGGLSLFSWVFTAYMLTSTTTVPLVGKLGDMYGRKPFFMGGIAVFMVGSALAGLSQDMTQLIIFRGLQGFGAGAITACAFAIIGDIFAPLERGRYMGLFSAVFGFASILGPTVGGTITDNLSWRWVFYVNVPFGLVALGVLWYGFPWIRPPARGQRIDYFGVAALAGSIVPLLLALVWGGDVFAWGSPQIIGLFAAAAVGAGAFIYAEQRADEPIIPLELFRNRVFAVAGGVTFLTGVGMFGAITFMPMFVQGVLGASATSSGVVTTPLMLGMVVSSVLTGQIVSRTGRYRLLAIGGSAVLAAGMLLLTRMSAESSHAIAIRNMVVVGVGLGIGMPVLGLAVQNAVPYRLLGVVSSTSQFFRQIGGMLGVAIFGTLITTHLRDNLQANLPQEVTGTAPPAVLERLENPQVLLSPTALEQMEGAFASLGEAGPRLFEETIGAMRMTLSDGLELVFLLAFAIAFLAFLTTIFLPEIPLRATIDMEEDEPAAKPASEEARLPERPAIPEADELEPAAPQMSGGSDGPT